MATFCTEHPNRESWLRWRKNGVGASEVSVVLGINTYKSAYTLWAEKTGRIEPEEPGLAAAVGVAIEPMIAGLYAPQEQLELFLGPLRLNFVKRHAVLPHKQVVAVGL